jgi:hypothetical protein
MKLHHLYFHILFCLFSSSRVQVERVGQLLTRHVLNDAVSPKEKLSGGNNGNESHQGIHERMNVFRGILTKD